MRITLTATTAIELVTAVIFACVGDWAAAGFWLLVALTTVGWLLATISATEWQRIALADLDEDDIDDLDQL